MVFIKEHAHFLPPPDGVSVSPSSFEVLIPAGEITGCGDISFVDNKIGLQDDIVFPITVTVIDPPGLMTIAQESTLTIVDDEGVDLYTYYVAWW